MFIFVSKKFGYKVRQWITKASQDISNCICEALSFASHDLMIIVHSKYDCAAACVGERDCRFRESCGFVTQTFSKFQGLALTDEEHLFEFLPGK